VHVDFPYHVDARGRSGETTDEDHVRDLIEQVLFTAPGERVNRPDFGTGLHQLVFGPNSEELAASIQMLVRGALQQWLGDRIRVDAVIAESRDATLVIEIRYTLTLTRLRASARFTRPTS
jgi:phage baseplate assembly protein W